MNPFTERRDLNRMSRKPPKHLLSAEEAATRITSKLTSLNPTRELNKELLQFWVEKLVLDVLDYCHRTDFPDALIYTCVDLIQKRLADLNEALAGDTESEAVSLPLSEIKMNDTQFKFSTDLVRKTIAPDNIGLLSDLDFDSIKPRLNLYRRVVSR